MFSRRAVYRPAADERYQENITSLSMRGSTLLIGREDGGVECHHGNYSCIYKAFSPEFDYLENEEIKERTVALELGMDGGVNDIVYAANEKTIKVLDIRNASSTVDIINSRLSPEYSVKEKKTCRNVHSYVINSISLNTSGESLLSSDFIKINLWRTSRMEQYFNLLDIKPQLFGGSTFVITSSKFSPFDDSLFAYSTSGGEIAVHDIDISPRSQCVASLKNTATHVVKSVFDVSFVDSNQIVSRSLNTVSLFDLRNTSEPVFTKELITDPVEQTLLNSSEAIYQTFDITNNGSFAFTGSCFGVVFCVDLLNGSVEEVLVGDERKIDVANRIKHIVFDGSGFACAYDGQLIRYTNDR